MTQHDTEVLAQFAVGWRMLKYDPTLRACLTLELCAFLNAHCREFDHQAYWGNGAADRGWCAMNFLRDTSSSAGVGTALLICAAVLAVWLLS